MRARKAFTLVELLVVISIIALLIAILVPSLKKARDQTKRVVCSANLRSISQAMLTYAVENNDIVPPNQGAEPSYVYIRGSTLIDAPGKEWHLGELLMKQMNMEPIRRGTDDKSGTKKFADAEMRRTASAGEVFYCPATGNGKNLNPNFPTWGFPTSFGAIMDYAHIWNYVGAETRVINGMVVPVTANPAYIVMNDQQEALLFDNLPNNQALYRLPHNVSRRNYRRLPNSGPASEVPVFAEYVTSFFRTQQQYASEYPTGGVEPQGGNHRSTGRTSSSGIPVIGGNYSYVDGHVEWRTPANTKPRLIINKVFTGGTNKPTYWW
ncbi:MAG: type II secretion system protein [Phycisphaerales bacterium]|nr:type II secretion system protein [Phycisphaerales bacterium]